MNSFGIKFSVSDSNIHDVEKLLSQLKEKSEQFEVFASTSDDSLMQTCSRDKAFLSNRCFTVNAGCS